MTLKRLFYFDCIRYRAFSVPEPYSELVWRDGICGYTGKLKISNVYQLHVNS